jgi:FkbM family methyltransferase
MKIKLILKTILLLPLNLLDFIAKIYCGSLKVISPNFSAFWSEKQSKESKCRTTKIHHSNTYGKKITFEIYTPNWICTSRARSFSSKEPMTLEWIDGFSGSGPFFDIGANVGLYSLYFAKLKNKSVYAFEPSYFNLGLLAKNISLNRLEDKIKIISNPLFNKIKFANFNLSSFDEGGAHSAFDVNYGDNGLPLRKVLSYKTLGFSIDNLFDLKMITEIPELIKIDVDGIEHVILEGAIKTLKNKKCKSVLIEINISFKKQTTQVSKILKSCGFRLFKTEKIGDERNSFIANQIWMK